MNNDFVQDSDIDTARRPVLGQFTGWELVIFELEDSDEEIVGLSGCQVVGC